MNGGFSLSRRRRRHIEVVRRRSWWERAMRAGRRLAHECSPRLDLKP